MPEDDAMTNTELHSQPTSGDRITSSVTSVSWIPSELITGPPKWAFDLGVTHYDEPPPDRIDGPQQLDLLQASGRFRFVNELRAWVEVLDGRIVDAGYDGRSRISSTSVRMGRRTGLVFEPIAFPEIRAEVMVDGERASFVQTTGGRTGMPSPRHVHRPPFFRWASPPVWTTLRLTIHADGRTEHELLGASRFPRHWIYGPDGALVAKTGLTDFDSWYRNTLETSSPWGHLDSPALVTSAGNALERDLSASLLHDHRNWGIRRLLAGETLLSQGDRGSKLFVLLDGVLAVNVDGKDVVDLAPGAVVGEHALLRGGRRTATLVAATNATVAVVTKFDRSDDRLASLAVDHLREQRTTRPGTASAELVHAHDLTGAA
jgi:hypothetical protein